MKKLAGLFKNMAGAGVKIYRLIKKNARVDLFKVEENLQCIRGGRVQRDAEDAEPAQRQLVPSASASRRVDTAASCRVQWKPRGTQSHQ
jgi:hypothetical protein